METNQKTKENKKGKKKGKGTGKKVAVVIIIILLVIAAIFAYRVMKNGGGLKGFLATAVGHDENTVKNLPKIYCLLLGTSQNLTDTIMIAEYDPKEQQASILSIPRDTFIGDNKKKATAWDKVNSVYQLGVDKLLKEINELTGLNIQYYLQVDTKAFTAIVDAIGGVTFDVPIDMKYDDGKQNLHINLKAGVQKLDGDKAEQVVRFRHNNDGTTYPSSYGIEDMGRMKTQRAFLTALAKQTLKPENLFKVNEFIEIANQYVKTNMDFTTLKNYAPYLLEFNADNLKTGHLPGQPELTNGVWVYATDETKAAKMIDELFLNPNQDDNTAISTNVSKEERENVKVEVLNGSGSSSKLEKITTKLKEAGYKVTKTGNTSDTENTTIINRNNVKNSIIEELKGVLAKATTSTGQTTTADLTIIIGKDY